MSHPDLSTFRRAAPPLARVRQTFPTDRIEGIQGVVKEKLDNSGLLTGIEPGARIAITAGSRGMGGFKELLSGIAEAVRSKGGVPFLIPAMGSHGGANPEGQLEILRRLGVRETEVGAEIRSTMETTPVGKCRTGAVAHIDGFAAESDGIIVLGRVKSHPENREGVASGLLKMITVGLGKQVGAQEAHTHGLWDSVENVPRITLEKAKILCGVAVVENALRSPVEIQVVEPRYEAFHDADERLLKIAQTHFADLPFEQLDLLILDELGKDISGTGMDLNVIGKWRIEGGDRRPDFSRIAVLSLTHASLRNGLGIGLADVTTERFVQEFDWQTTYVNLLTATEPGVINTREGKLPIALSSDQEAIETALFSSLASARVPRVCRIKNTAELDEIWISESLLDELNHSERFVFETDPEPLRFDGHGNLF